MRAGILDQRVMIQKREVARDSYGAEKVTWVDAFPVWAAVEPLAGQSYLLGKAQTDEVTIRVRLRYFPGLLPTMRIVHGSGDTQAIYTIQDIQHIQSGRREYVVMCKQVVNSG